MTTFGRRRGALRIASATCLRLVAILPFAFFVACGHGQMGTTSRAFDDVVRTGPRVLWVAAHPDDEALTGGLLAHLCVGEGLPCHFVVLNRGRGGECCLGEGCGPDLGAVRHREMSHAAELYGATVEHYDFFNAQLPVESFPTRAELEARWMLDGDPVGLVARAVRRFQPQIVLVFDPYHGFTGHPEHPAASRTALAGVRMAADSGASSPFVADEKPYRLQRIHIVQNKDWFFNIGREPGDVGEPTDVIDTMMPCRTSVGIEVPCVEVGARFTRAHRSQNRDMRRVRAASKMWSTVYLRQLDPYGDEADALMAELGVR